MKIILKLSFLFIILPSLFCLYSDYDYNEYFKSIDKKIEKMPQNLYYKYLTQNIPDKSKYKEISIDDMYNCLKSFSYKDNSLKNINSPPKHRPYMGPVL